MLLFRFDGAVANNLDNRIYIACGAVPVDASGRTEHITPGAQSSGRRSMTQNRRSVSAAIRGPSCGTSRSR